LTGKKKVGAKGRWRGGLIFSTPTCPLWGGEKRQKRGAPFSLAGKRRGLEKGEESTSTPAASTFEGGEKRKGKIGPIPNTVTVQGGKEKCEKQGRRKMSKSSQNLGEKEKKREGEGFPEQPLPARREQKKGGKKKKKGGKPGTYLSFSPSKKKKREKGEG